MRDQQAAGGQGVVADHLRVHPEPRPAREQPVLRVLLDLLRRGRRRLPVGGRGDQELEEPLHVPARLAELDGQPVEQLGMRGKLAADPEVSRRADQAGPEDFLPEPVDRHPGGQRMLGPEQPPGKAQPVAGQVAGHRGQHVGRVGLHRVAALVVFAAVEDIGHGRLGPLLHHVGDGSPGADRGLLLLERAVAWPAAPSSRDPEFSATTREARRSLPGNDRLPACREATGRGWRRRDPRSPRV